MEKSIEITKTVNATYEVRDTAKGITAHVRVRDNNTVEAVENGNVARGDNPNAATFSSWGPDSLHVQYNTPDGRTALLADIEAFINALRDNIATLV